MFLKVDTYDMIVCASRVIFVESYVLQQEAGLHSHKLFLLVKVCVAMVATRQDNFTCEETRWMGKNFRGYSSTPRNSLQLQLYITALPTIPSSKHRIIDSECKIGLCSH